MSSQREKQHDAEIACREYAGLLIRADGKEWTGLKVLRMRNFQRGIKIFISA
jgi:hypothetical protein